MGPRVCAAAYCHETKHLFSWPKKSSVSSYWTSWVKTNVSNFKLTTCTRLCFKHFAEDAFHNMYAYLVETDKRLKLKDTALPTVRFKSEEEAMRVHTPRKRKAEDAQTPLDVKERRRLLREVEAANAPSQLIADRLVREQRVIKAARRDKCVSSRKAKYKDSQVHQADAGLLSEKRINIEKMSSKGENLRYVANPHLQSMEDDILFHINISTKTHDVKKMFGDVKFVCMGGSSTRMLHLAKFFAEELSAHISETPDFKNLTGTSDRYVIYKVGPVLTVSHGIGMASVSIIFNEICKLLSHAGATDVTLFRLGTSGGVGVVPGTVVITTEPVNGELKSVHEEFILGRRVVRESILDHALTQELMSCQPSTSAVPVVTGKTMSCNDFYEGEARVDGAICDFTQKEKLEFLHRIYDEGVRNIEMEASGIGAWANKVKMRAGVVCVTLLDRLKGDQVTSEPAVLKEFEMRPAIVVARYMLKKLSK